jgi:hypothetical protein
MQQYNASPEKLSSKTALRARQCSSKLGEWSNAS